MYNVNEEIQIDIKNFFVHLTNLMQVKGSEQNIGPTVSDVWI
jgi:hypothetical protein